jgi:hypothetical protein
MTTTSEGSYPLVLLVPSIYIFLRLDTFLRPLCSCATPRRAALPRRMRSKCCVSVSLYFPAKVNFVRPCCCCLTVDDFHGGTTRGLIPSAEKVSSSYGRSNATQYCLTSRNWKFILYSLIPLVHLPNVCRYHLRR